MQQQQRNQSQLWEGEVKAVIEAKDEAAASEVE